MNANHDQPSRNNALVIYRPLVEKVLAALGALVTHQLAYTLAPLSGSAPVAPSDHGHLSLQWAIVTPLAVAGVAALIVWQLKSLGFRSVVPARKLGALIVGFFLVQEMIEGLAAGHTAGGVLTNPAVVAGVIIGPLIAWLLSRVLAGVTDLAVRLLSPDAAPEPAVRQANGPQGTALASMLVRSASRPRAPPSLLRF